MKIKVMLLITSFAVSVNAVVDLGEPDINFVVRQDYIDRGQIDQKTLLSFQTEGLQGLQRATYMAFINSKETEKFAKGKKALIYTVVAKHIANILNDYFDKTRAAKNIEYNTLTKPSDIEKDTTRLKGIIGEQKIQIGEQKIQDLLTFLKIVLADNIIDSYDILKPQARFWRNELYINTDTFEDLNEYLKLVYKYGVFLLFDLTYTQKQEFNTDIYSRAKEFNSLALYILLNRLQTDIKELSRITNNGDKLTIDILQDNLKQVQSFSVRYNKLFKTFEENFTEDDSQKNEIDAIFSNTLDMINELDALIIDKIRKTQTTPMNVPAQNALIELDTALTMLSSLMET